MTRKLLLGVDIGTYSSKGVLVNSDGTLVGSSVIAHELSSPKPGHFEHDADGIWWHDFVFIVRDLLERTKASPEEIAGVGTSGIGPCVLPIDDNGKPLRPGILYGIDSRALKEVEYLQDTLKSLPDFSHPIPELSSQAAGPKILWIRRNEPEIYAKARWFLTSQSYLIYKLTGKAAIDIYSAGGYSPIFDSKTTKYIPELEPYITEVNKLADMFWSHEVVGQVTVAASLETGIPAGTPVVAGTTDASAEALSAGLGNFDDMLIMFGSSNFFVVKTKELIKPKKFWASNFLGPGTYAFLGGMATSGSLTRWFLNQFGQPEIEASVKTGQDPYGLLAELSQKSPPGSNGLVMLPYFEGERTPIQDPKAKGLLFGLSLKHTREDVYRSILESVAFGIRHNLEEMKAEGVFPKRILAVGGGTKNPAWMQIVSNIASIELHIPEQQIGASYGDAFLAGLGVGMFKEYADISKWVKIKEVIKPNNNNRDVYDFNYLIYRDLYTSTNSIMHRISDAER